MQGITYRGSKEGKVLKASFTHQRLEPDEVVVQVTHSGLCGTDLHFLTQDMALGHEAVGIVKAVGASCKLLKEGDRVGWGYEHMSCGVCPQCLSGSDRYCPEAKMYGQADLDQGSFSNIGVWKETWLFRIPDGLPSEYAGPLMCGGATVFMPLVEYCRSIDRVGIVGIGGLGHLAIQFAAKMGCDVVAFSGTDSKREEALSLGAKEFYATNGFEDLSKLGITKPVDRLIITTSSLVNLGQYYPILSPEATIMPLTVSPDMLVAPNQGTIVRGIKIIGSILASRYIQNKMLEFADRNNVRPIIEKFPMSEQGINEAIQKLKDGKMRYRGVLSWDY
ncbi:NADP-dependent alcohol dehydrogenase [Gymnopus androsaceus JB14]|uniref:NADP-dependent alcohol dehydrogenase n=1 Tax=Gymnopus androsaceus JB14 TaxID=1447944 RepID=A0A6A4GZE9_9AGAR|nr:NADP-dependent alcohol dehydrogenase [Gymnopus androsaceus JB14]